MKLQDLFRIPGFPKQVDFAAELGITHSYLCRLMSNGKQSRNAGYQLAERIVKAAAKHGVKITVKDLNPRLYAASVRLLSLDGQVKTRGRR